MQIVADVLAVTEQTGQEGIKTTSLLTKANLSHSRLEKFVSNLTGAGLINKIEFDGEMRQRQQQQGGSGSSHTSAASVHV